MISLSELLGRFHNVRGGGDRFQASCPCHRDKEPSLSIKAAGDKYLLHCHAGCDTKDILSAVGLKYSDVDSNIQPSGAERASKEKWAFYLENLVGDNHKVKARYDYLGERGEYLYSNIRLENGAGKTFRQGVIEGERINLSLSGVERTLYNLPRIVKTVRTYKDKYPVFIVEGEKDAETLKSLGLVNVTTTGGAKSWRGELSKYFVGADVVILPDNDQAGAAFANEVIAKIKPFASRITVCAVSDKPKGDVTDFIEAGHTKAELLSMIKEAQQNIVGITASAPAPTSAHTQNTPPAQPSAYPQTGANATGLPAQNSAYTNSPTHAQTSPGSAPIRYSLISNRYCWYPDWLNIKLKRNEDGSVSVKKTLNVDNLSAAVSEYIDYFISRVSGANNDSLFVYENGVYSPYNDNQIDEIIRRFIPRGMARSAIIRDVRNLLMCSPGRVIPYEDVNANERYINLKNGIYDLKEDKLIPHTPRLISTIQYNCGYDENAEAPTFTKYISDLCTDDEGDVDQTEIDLLQEWTGLILSNIPIYKVKKALILYSAAGNTGKTQFLALISHLIGREYVGGFDLQTLCGKDDRFSTSGLIGKRMNINGDQRSDEIETTSMFKMLTGGDAIKVEPKGKQAFSYKYGGGLLFACNDLPAFSTDKGGYMFDRFCIIPCDNIIPAERRDRGLLDKLKREADGVFTWALEGLKRLIKNDFNFTLCPRSEFALDDYQDRLDSVGEYLRLYCTITDNPKDRIAKSNLDFKYERWATDNQRRPVGKRNMIDRLAKHGVGYRKKYCGYPCYICIKPKNKDLLVVEDEGAEPEHLPEAFEDIIT